MSARAHGTSIVLAVVLCAVAGPAFGVQHTATWTGAGGDALWSNALNWNPHVVPCNDKSNEYNVVIPTGIALVDHDPAAGDCPVRSLTLNNNSTLRVSPGSSLTVTTTASLCGKLEALGDFTATESRSTLTSFSCTRARIEAQDGALVWIDANQNTSTGLWSDDGSAATISTFTWPLISADGRGTYLSLSNVAHLDAGFATTGNDTNIQRISANGAATLDLSGLLTVRAPSSIKDHLEFVTDENGGFIDLASLTTLNSAGQGYTLFNLTSAGNYLPSLTSMRQVCFALDSYAFLSLGPDRCTYSSTGFWADDGSSSISSTFTWPLMSVSGGSSLDLSTVTDMDVRIVPTGNDANVQTISASSGGTITLSGLASLAAPASARNRLEFNLDGFGSNIDFSALTTLTTAGSGSTRVNLTNEALVYLPSITSIEQVMFNLDSMTSVFTNGLPCTYSSAGFWGNDGSSSITSTFIWPLMTVNGASSLELSGITDMDAAIVTTGNDTNIQTISVAGGGFINLAGVGSITAPVSARDRVEFNLDSSGSSIDFSSLTTLTSAGSGSLRFNLSNGASLFMPSLTSMEQVMFTIDTGAALSTGGLRCAYSSTGFWADDGSSSVSSTFTWPLMTVSGGGVLELSGVTGLDAGFVATGNDANIQTISVGDTYVDLSSLQSITAPASIRNRLEVRLDGPSSSISLGSLTTMNSAGSGYTKWVMSNDASEYIPSLSSMEQVVFDLDSAADLFVDGSDGAYSSRGFWADDGNPSASSTFTWPLMTVRNSALLLCTGLSVIDAGFASTGNDTNVQQISLTGGGHIELEALQSIIAPVAANDRVELGASGAESFLYLPSLRELKSAGNGTFRIHLDNQALMDTGSLTIRTPTTVTIDGAGTYLHVANGNLHAFASSTINLNDPGALLDVDGSLVATNNIHIAAADGARINIGGNLSFTHTNEDEFRLGGAIVMFDGSAPQTLEVGGLDVGLDCAQLTNDNFGFAQLIVGQFFQTSVALRNDVDNGNQPGATPETLYLFGDGGKDPSLQITAGSTLILNGIQVYLCDSGVHLNELFGPDQTIIPFDGGFIDLGVPPVAGDLDGDGVVNTLDLGILLASWSIPESAPGCMDAIDCPGDINRDGVVNTLDLGILLSAWTL